MNKKPEWLHMKVPSGLKHRINSKLLILCAVAGLIFTGTVVTYAILKTVTPTETNVFQSDKHIKITLDEPQWEEHGRLEASAYVPGQRIDKDPTVTLENGSAASYVALKVQYFNGSNQELTGEEFTNLYLNKEASEEADSAGIDYSDMWEYAGLSDTAYGEVYIYKNILSHDNKMGEIEQNITEPLFTRVYLSKDIMQDKETKRLPDFNIKVTAYAIQAQGITYENAKTELLDYIRGISA